MSRSNALQRGLTVSLEVVNNGFDIGVVGIAREHHLRAFDECLRIANERTQRRLIPDQIAVAQCLGVAEVRFSCRLLPVDSGQIGANPIAQYVVTRRTGLKQERTASWCRRRCLSRSDGADTKHHRQPGQGQSIPHGGNIVHGAAGFNKGHLNAFAGPGVIMVTRREFLDTLASAGALAATAAGQSLAQAQSAPAAVGHAAATDPLAGRITFRGEARYEALRQAASWNARKPNRFPNAIVLAESDGDVIAAVKLAAERNWQVSTRSGGHSWSTSHTRDNSVQINLARMKQLEVDPDAMIARISPSTYGNVLNKQLREQYQLFTPSAHGVNVGMGGFAMCGGHGWNSRVFGLGCENLVALDLVDSRGDLIHASESENSDYLWAARGSGPGFFGTATRYYVRLHPRPQLMRTRGFVFGGEELETVVGWVRDTMGSFPLILEVVMIGRQKDGEPVFTLIGNCLGNSEAEVSAALAILDACPAVPRAKSSWLRDFIVPLDVEPPTDSNPTGARFAVDNIWTNASSAALLPLVRPLFSNFPTPASYVFIQVWGPVRKLPDMAYSVQGDIYISSNAVYYDPADDARCEAWAVQAMRNLDAISIGAQMNDENIQHHPARYLSAEAAKRLEKLRHRYDPQNRFPGYLKPEAIPVPS